MSAWPRRLSAVVVILYGALIVWLFSLEFAGAYRLSDSEGNLELSALVLPENAYRDTWLVWVSLKTDWFDISFHPGQSVIARRPGGSRSPLRPEEIDQTEAGYIIRFENGVRIEAANEPETEGNTTMTVTIDENNERFLGLEFPFRPADSTTRRQTGNSPLLLRSTTGGSYILTLPDHTSYDRVNRRVVLPGTPGTYILRTTFRESTEGEILDWWTATAEDTISASEVSDAIEAFLERAWSNWLDEHYSLETGTWARPDGGQRFDERIAVALLAEAWQRDTYPRVASQMRDARGMHRERTTYRIAPFLGDLEQYTDDMIREIREEISAIETLVKHRDPTVFERDDRWTGRSVFTVAHDHGSDELVTSLLEFAREVDPEALDFSTLLSLYEARYQFESPDISGLAEALEHVSNLVESMVIERIRNTENGFFVQTDENAVNVLESLRAGLVLRAMDHGESRIREIGDRLVYDALALADAGITLPRHLELEGSSIVGASGHISAVDVYPFISDNPRLPRFVSPDSPFPSDGFIWTIADLSDIQVTQSSMQMRVHSPPERTHYLYVHGMESISRVEIFGQENWQGDPDFERYIRGHYFDAESSTLKVKYTDDISQRTMALYF